MKKDCVGKAVENHCRRECDVIPDGKVTKKIMYWRVRFLRAVF